MRIKRKPNQNEVVTITKIMLVQDLATELGISKLKSTPILHAVIDTMIQLITDGRSVIIKGSGILSIKQKSERPGLNPKTGEYHLVTARKVVTFGHLKNNKNRAAMEEMSNIISSKANVKYDAARIALNIVINAIKKVSEGNCRVEFRGLGVFFYTDHPAKIRRNPKTGESVRCDEQIFVRFKCSKLLLKAINGDAQ